MKIGELAQRSGLSIYTIRYYERIGVLPRSDRQSGQRRYDDSSLRWIEFIVRMKASGMPIKEIIGYASLWKQGFGTETERRTLLENQRKRVVAQIHELQSSLRLIDSKIGNLKKLKEG